jgi:hypothetical protein
MLPKPAQTRLLVQSSTGPSASQLNLEKQTTKRGKNGVMQNIQLKLEKEKE